MAEGTMAEGATTVDDAAVEAFMDKVFSDYAGANAFSWGRSVIAWDSSPTSRRTGPRQARSSRNGRS
jgi:hypothetical protein